MKGLTLAGVVLIVVGVAALLIGHFSYTETKPLLKAGPLQVNTQQEHSIDIPTIAGIVIIVAGVLLVFAGRRSS